ncbi:hypothetical protein Acr_00g0068720 [Actinidia rufa]|uniref:Uncharacterized protein n=1 Tax=Actinidia rufa TaxID=165716 RepID=A0A7J0DS72_9ERIC|nr:hypothetical protein Acr_00g0068720 [Actinidia rufa]
MTNEVNQLPLSPLEESPPRDELPNQGKILEGSKTRIPREGETILSARKGKFFALDYAVMSFSGKDNDASGDGTVAALGDKGVSCPPPETNIPRVKAPRDGSVEYIGTINKEWRRILTLILDLTILRLLLWGKVQDPLGLGQFSPSSSSDSRLESWISLTKISKKVEESKASTSSIKGMVFLEKGPRDKSSNFLAKRLNMMSSRRKKTIPPIEAKKPKPNRVESMGIMCPAAPGEGTLKKPGKVLEVGVSAMASDAMAKKILVGVILPNKKEKVNKLSLDQVATKFFHNLGQRIVLGSSLTIRRLLAEFDEREQKAAEEMAKLRDDQEPIIEELAKMEMVVADLRRKKSSNLEVYH